MCRTSSGSTRVTSYGAKMGKSKKNRPIGEVAENGDDVVIKVVDKVKHADLKTHEKWAVIAFCMEGYDGRIEDGRAKAAAKRFGIAERTIRSIVQEYRKQLDDDTVFPDLAPKSRENCGPKSGLTDEVRENIEALHAISEGRYTYAEFATEYNKAFGVDIPTSTMYGYLAQLGVTQHRAYLKPMLTVKQRIKRLDDGAGGRGYQAFAAWYALSTDHHPARRGEAAHGQSQQGAA